MSDPITDTLIGLGHTPDLKAILDQTAKGLPQPNLNNAVRIFEHGQGFAGLVWKDEFLQRIMTGDPPREWTDADDIEQTIRIQREIGIPNMAVQTVSMAVIAVANQHARNCVRDWLDSLVWDEVERLDHFFEDHFGAAGTRYIRAASRNFCVSMVARIYRPGCQVDTMPVLEGPQGIRKTSALRVIGGEWFTEQHESASNPKAFGEVLQGKWLVEISELDAFTRADITRVKATVSNVNDRYRESYGRKASDHPRQCVFVGTTNRDDWNHDETGARRFWPIACSGDIDVAAIANQREQLFAEAVARYKAGATWWEMPEEETRNEQQARYSADPWTDAIVEFTRLLATVTVNEILVDGLKFDVSRIGKKDQMRVATCLRALEWKRHTERTGSLVRKVWKRS